MDEPGIPKQEKSHCRLTAEGLLVKDWLRLSFQRCEFPPLGVHVTPPRSLGMLHLARSKTGDLYLPLAQGESFWIGLTCYSREISLQCAIQSTDGRTVDVSSGLETLSIKDAAPIPLSAESINGVHDRGSSVRAFGGPGEKREADQCHRLVLRITPLVPSETDQPVQRSDVAAANQSLSAVITIVDYVGFRAATGLQPPASLDPSTGYGGWLLP